MPSRADRLIPHGPGSSTYGAPMPDTPIITISCSNGLRTSGEVISGVINLNLALAEEKDVIAVTISLRGEINTQVTVDHGNANDRSTTTHRDSVRLFAQKQTIWEPGYQLPPHTSGVASFPFSFAFPTMNLPPSFHGGTGRTGGSVQYYLHAVAVRKSWYKLNVRIDHVFPFLPIDTTPAPFSILPNWPDEWQIFSSSKKMRRGIISHHGLAIAEFHMPKMQVIPLFRPIPIRLRVLCSSKPLPRSALDQPEKFDFPRIPKLVDVDLTLRQECNVVVGMHHRRCTDQLGLQAGFGLPEQVSARATWGTQVQTVATSPHWVVDEMDSTKGHWTEEIVFSSTLIFRCPPPFSSPSLTSSIYLDLDIDFPGLGNRVKTQIGPLPLTSGIAPSESQGEYFGAPTSTGPSTPAYASQEMDLPPTYYEVLRMEEKEGRANDDD